MENNKLLRKISELMKAVKTVLQYRKVYKYDINVTIKNNISLNKIFINVSIYSFKKYTEDKFNSLVYNHLGILLPKCENEFINTFIEYNPDFFIINIEDCTTVNYTKIYL